MRRQIKKHLRDFVAIIVLVVVAVGIGGYILAHQRVTLPAWVPLVGQDFYRIKAQFSTGQSIVPGQGQAVKIAGVKVGEITAVAIENGQALISMKIKRRYAPVYKNATMLFSPTTLVKNENIAMDSGSKDAGPLCDGCTLPQANTKPDVNLDEFLATFDADTREYLRILLSAGAQGLGDRGQELSATFRRLNMMTLYLDRINSKVAERRRNLRRLIHNFQLLVTEVGSKDKELAQLVDSVNANFQAFASQDQALKETVHLLPGTLSTTRQALGKADRTAKLLGPTLAALRPGARALAPSLKALRPLFKETEPVVRTQLRPFARDAQGPVSDLQPAAERLTRIAPKLASVFGVLNYLFNELAYDPAGDQQPLIFWLAWANHNLSTVASTQDATGAKLRGLIGLSCDDLTNINSLVANPQFKQVKLLLLSLGAPDKAKVC